MFNRASTVLNGINYYKKIKQKYWLKVPIKRNGVQYQITILYKDCKLLADFNIDENG